MSSPALSQQASQLLLDLAIGKTLIYRWCGAQPCYELDGQLITAAPVHELIRAHLVENVALPDRQNEPRVPISLTAAGRELATRLRSA